MTMTTANELLDRCVEAARHGDCETVLRYLVSMREALAEAGPVCVVCGRPILPMIAAAAITVSSFDLSRSPATERRVAASLHGRCVETWLAWAALVPGVNCHDVSSIVALRGPGVAREAMA